MTLLDKDIREPLFQYLEERYGMVRILEEKEIASICKIVLYAWMLRVIRSARRPWSQPARFGAFGLKTRTVRRSVCPRKMYVPPARRLVNRRA